jgi:hypothetical protein
MVVVVHHGGMHSSLLPGRVMTRPWVKTRVITDFGACAFGALVVKLQNMLLNRFWRHWDNKIKNYNFALTQYQYTI